MSTLKTTNLQHASAASPAIVLASDGTATAQLSSLNGGALSGARNRIINGDMRIDQRNAGASVTPTNGQFSVDRWACFLAQASKYSVQQNAGSITPPAGFTKYAGITSLSTYSVGASEWFGIAQRIEGFNIADLNWGTASAISATLSFWVRSSLTGTFGGSINNNGFSYNYPFSFAINSANTWEYKTVSITAPTSGTWLSDNSSGAQVHFSLGTGSSYASTAGTWSSTANILTATGATSVVGTNGATFYITGVQLEAGSVSTPYERRSYGQELALCERYYQVNQTELYIYYNGSATLYGPAPFRTKMRATPSAMNATNITYYGNGFSVTASIINEDGGRINYPASTGGYNGAQLKYNATAEL